MSLLAQIANSTTTTAAPSAKFVGRPAAACRKCKSIFHWVNTMGGIQCVTCSPPPSSLTESDIASRKLVVSSGIWNVDDGSFSQENSYQRQATPATPQSTISREFDHSDYSSLFVDCDASGAVYRDSETGEYVFQNPFPKWTHDEQTLVDWFLETTKPNSATFTHLASRLKGQRVSRWEVVTDATRYLTDFRERCLEGPQNPANCYGGMICDLRRLWVWVMENEAEEHAEMEVKPQPQLSNPLPIKQLQPLNLTGLTGLNLLQGLKIKL